MRRKRKRQTKAQGQEQHAIRRMHERYGIRLDTSHYRALCNQIKGGRSLYVGPGQSSRVTRHIVRRGGLLFPVVYDKHRCQITTFLPSWALKQALHECDPDALKIAFARWGLDPNWRTVLGWPDTAKE